MAAPATTPEPGKGPGYYEDLINRVDTRIEEGGAAAEAPHPTTPVGPLPFVCHNHSLLALFFAADGEVPPVMASCACCIDVGPLRRRQRFYVFFFVMTLTFFTYGNRMTKILPPSALDMFPCTCATTPRPFPSPHHARRFKSALCTPPPRPPTHSGAPRSHGSFVPRAPVKRLGIHLLGVRVHLRAQGKKSLEPWR